MMIRFEQGDNLFNYRVVGVALHNESVLLHQAEGDSFWTCPGGRAEFGETAEQTLTREMREELGVEIEIVRLLWFVENFFTYAEKRCHEIALYFLMRLPATSKYAIEPGPYQCLDEASKLTFQWFPLRHEVFSSLQLLPAFLQTALLELPETAQHVVQIDESVD